jgi:2-oxoglutarate ferredoxin oxidoreductase subunit beta
MTATPAPLTKKDFKTDQDVRWCPGCGDYAILNAVQSAFAKLGKRRHETVIVSGIGCSSRFPYYMETFGFHTIHGRAPAIATGVKLAAPELDVWVVTGDGDSLSIGGNHLIHVLRRNVDLKILLFNNRIYGLTKGQYSPTSERGKKTKSTPLGSIDEPFHPLGLALGAGASFVARSIDIFADHLTEMIERMDRHEGTALLEIYQNCNIFNDGAFKDFTEKDVRDDRTLRLEHGTPLVFGPEGARRGIAFDENLCPLLVDVRPDGSSDREVVVWDEASPNPAAAMALANMSEAEMPVPIGVFRKVERATFEAGTRHQIARAQERNAESLDDLLTGGETWVVGAAQS